MTLVASKNLTPEVVYGTLFNVLADQIDVIKETATRHYHDAIKEGVSPAGMQADFALEELGLAERANVTDMDGMPKFTYYDFEDTVCGCEPDCDCE